MTPQKSSRGRPKGTGLNDAAQLRAIAGLIAQNPDLRPTTAIKTLGITDPSVIRRLRDKYAQAETTLNAELGPRASVNAAANMARDNTTAATAEPLVKAFTGQAASQPARVVPLVGARIERKTGPVAAVICEAPAATAPATLPAQTLTRRPRSTDLIAPPSETELPNWMGVGLSVFVLSVEAQYAMVGTMFQWPPFAAVLRSSVAFSEMAVALSAPASGARAHG